MRRTIRKLVENRGYILRKTQRGYHSFNDAAKQLERPEYAQTVDDARALAKQFEEPVFGTVQVMELLARLENVIDPSDQSLGSTNQLVHVLQILNEMEEDGITDPDMQITGLIHDLGKLLLLTDTPVHVALGTPKPIGQYQPGVGLDNCVFRWTNDEFVYARFKDYLPDPIAWLLRYHTIDIDACTPLMDERDLEYKARYLRPFYRYDQGSKSPYYRPPNRLEQYRDLVAEYFPDPIAF